MYKSDGLTITELDIVCKQNSSKRYKFTGVICMVDAIISINYIEK